jgi:hypothetical protein
MVKFTTISLFVQQGMSERYFIKEAEDAFSEDPFDRDLNPIRKGLFALFIQGSFSVKYN